MSLGNWIGNAVLLYVVLVCLNNMRKGRPPLGPESKAYRLRPKRRRR